MQSDLRVGDCLLYRPRGLFGAIIEIKTWHPIAHCEVYAGKDRSWASRDGLGVGYYPFRVDGLVKVLRPTVRFSRQRSSLWAMRQRGTPYGWLELLNFIGLPVHGHGLFCSQFVVGYYRAGGWDMFPEDTAAQVAPFEFLSLVGAGFEDISASA